MNLSQKWQKIIVFLFKNCVLDFKFHKGKCIIIKEIKLTEYKFDTNNLKK